MKLVMIHNDRRMHTPLTAGKQVLGRGKDADIQISDPAISRHHVELTLEGDSLMVKDLGSKNGFKSGGRRVESITLEHNQSFMIGDITFVFQTRDDEVPGAGAPRETDGTPMDAEFIPTAGSNQQPEPPKILPVAVVPVAQADPSKPPAARKALSPKMLLAGLPVLILALAAIFMKKNEGNINPAQPSIPSVTPSAEWTLEDYQKSCENAHAAFLDYFSDPSRHFSRLAEAVKLVEEPFNNTKFRRHGLAESLTLIYSTFSKVGHDWSQLDLLQLNAILDEASKLTTSRHTSPKLKMAGQELMTWTEKQMASLNDLEAVRDLLISGDLENLEQANRQITSLSDNHIHAKSQSELKTEITRKLGEGYLSKGRAALGKGDITGAREALIKAKDYGQAEAADGILSQIEIATRNSDLYAQAEKALDADNLTTAAELLSKMQSSSEWDAKISSLRLRVELRSLVLQMRQAFTRGELDKLESLPKGHPQEQHPQVQKLLNDFRNLAATLKSGKAKFEEGRYAEAKTELKKVVDGILDDANVLKIEASNLLGEMDPKKLAPKHLMQAQEFLALTPAKLAKARAQLDIVQSLDKKLGVIEIKEINKVVGERLSAYHKAKASGDKMSIDAAKDGLRDAVAGLRSDPSAFPDTEGDLIRLINGFLR
ncbi:MAG: FHA domain-containing protein [Planctomycetota bacterium]